MSVDPETHGMNVYRTMLEDENQHIEDAVRTGIAAAVQEERRAMSEALSMEAYGSTWCVVCSGARERLDRLDRLRRLGHA